jgi:hypothetical protein
MYRGTGKSLFGRRLFWLAIGLIGGAYITQNYEIPRLERPSVMYRKFKAYMEAKRLNNVEASASTTPELISEFKKESEK